MSADTPVRVLGRYAICGVIGSGGMATVHVGRLLGPVGFSRTVAIKRMHPHLASDPEFVAMFLDEARIAAQVQHANVVSTIDVSTEGGELLLVMEYLEGESFARVLRAIQRKGARLPLPIVGAVLSQALYGLHAVHEARDRGGKSLGLIHRDVSPDNLLVGRDGVTRVLDFGIAKATEHGRRTQAGKVKGKLAYMAPEQLRGKDLDRRVDLYAASATLWEALAGRRLYDGPDPDVVKAILRGTPAPPSSVVPSLPAEVDALVLKGLATDPDQRYATAREMAIAVEQALGVASLAKVGQLIEGMLGPDLEKRSDIVQAALRATEAISLDGLDASSRSVLAGTPSSNKKPFVPNAAAPAPAGRPPGTDILALPHLDDLGELPAPRPGPIAAPAPGPGGAAPFGTRIGLGPGEGAELLQPPKPLAPTMPSAQLDIPPFAATGAATGGRLAEPARAPAKDEAVATEAEAPRPPSAPVGLVVDFGGARAAERAPGRASPAVARAEWAGRPPPAPQGGGSMRPLLLPLALVVLVVALTGAFLIVRARRSDDVEAARRAPTGVENAAACEALRRRVKNGGKPIGLTRDGWIVELWLRPREGRTIDGNALDLLSLTGDDPASKAEVTTLSAASRQTDEGVLVRLWGPVAGRAFEADEAGRLVKAADLAFERADAEAGALYMKCAHLPYHDMGLWFRGRDLPNTATALLFSIGLFSDVTVVRQDLLFPPGSAPRQTVFEDVRERVTRGKLDALQPELERAGATVQSVGGSGFRVVYSIDQAQLAVRGSRVVADVAGVESR
jgi:serine/threonine-protein kinase